MDETKLPDTNQPQKIISDRWISENISVAGWSLLDHSVYRVDPTLESEKTRGGGVHVCVRKHHVTKPGRYPLKSASEM